MATLNGTDLGRIQSEEVKITSAVTTLPIPDSDAESTLLLPLTGPVVKVSLAGIKSGDTSTLQSFISNLTTWVQNGGKLSESNLTFVGDLNFISGISVRAVDGAWDWVAGDPNKISYSLELIQGSFS